MGSSHYHKQQQQHNKNDLFKTSNHDYFHKQISLTTVTAKAKISCKLGKLGSCGASKV